ncbi:cupin domain-containing protein [Lapillicoccus sp.]|uniref:cupin domain-containing protein n=1 Tax=Lapillicoccus sp. TaxID=1909287 RepID=UPI0032665F9F
MTRSVSWDSGDQIPGTPFRHLIKAADTGDRFSAQSATIPPGLLVFPHSHVHEDEFTFVFRGRIGGRVGEQDIEVDEGGFLFKPRGVVHAMWNATDLDAIVLEFISPAGFEGFFEAMGSLSGDAGPAEIMKIADRYGQTPHPELVAELSQLYGVSP